MDLHDQNKVTVGQRQSRDFNSVIMKASDKEESFIYFSGTYGSVGEDEDIVSHYVSVSSVTLCDPLLLNSTFFSFISLLLLMLL